MIYNIKLIKVSYNSEENLGVYLCLVKRIPYKIAT
jgi:hypothetical protein